MSIDPMNRTSLSINVAFALSLILGAIIGWKLAFFQNFHYFKLINLCGVLLNLLGVMLLSYVVLAKDSIQFFLANHVSRYLVIFSGTIPASMSLSSLIAMFFGANSCWEVQRFAGVYAIVLVIPVYIIFGSPVFEPVGNKTYEPVFRIKVLGATFIGLGFVFQIIASVADILSDV